MNYSGPVVMNKDTKGVQFPQCPYCDCYTKVKLCSMLHDTNVYPRSDSTVGTNYYCRRCKQIYTVRINNTYACRRPVSPSPSPPRVPSPVYRESKQKVPPTWSELAMSLFFPTDNFVRR